MYVEIIYLIFTLNLILFDCLFNECAGLQKLFPGSKLDGIGADNYCAERGFKI